MVPNERPADASATSGRENSDVPLSRHYSPNSDAYSVMAGLGSHMTELITYRALMGASWFDYGNAGDTDCGWTYSLDANWRITRQLQFSALGKSYYQPSERTVGQAIKVYSLSGGFSYLTMDLAEPTLEYMPFRMLALCICFSTTSLTSHKTRYLVLSQVLWLQGFVHWNSP